MDPVTAALFVGANFLVTATSARTKAKIERTNIKLQTEQAKLQAAEAAYELSKTFRQNTSANLALSGLGIGGISGLSGANSESQANFLLDAASIKQQEKFAVLTGQSNLATSKANRFAATAGGVMTAAQLSKDLGLFAAKGGK